jgi:hypothetical protein
MLRTVAVLIAVMTLMSASQPASAYGFCSEPRPPWCANHGFNDKSSYESCRREMETYLRDVENYLECLRKKAKDTADESDKAVQRFNCNAEGRSVCF